MTEHNIDYIEEKKTTYIAWFKCPVCDKVQNGWETYDSGWKNQVIECPNCEAVLRFYTDVSYTKKDTRDINDELEDTHLLNN
jgi:transcription elongation factor Elf1